MKLFNVDKWENYQNSRNFRENLAATLKNPVDRWYNEC